jgi:hypothetical protein
MITPQFGIRCIKGDTLPDNPAFGEKFYDGIFIDEPLDQPDGSTFVRLESLPRGKYLLPRFEPINTRYHPKDKEK